MDVGQTVFNEMFWNSSLHILKRVCTTCNDSHKEIYYKRLTMLDSFDLYSYTDDWRRDNNTLGTDFNLYSTFDDASNDNNSWTFCNYDSLNIGMFRDCGPSGQQNWEWTSRVREGHNALFYIYSGSSKLGKYQNLEIALYSSTEKFAFCVRD